MLVDDEVQALDSFELALRSGNVNNFIRCQDSRDVIPLLAEQEIEVVREEIRKCGKQFFANVDVKGKDIIVYEGEHPSLKFTLCDDDKRRFVPSRGIHPSTI